MIQPQQHFVQQQQQQQYDIDQVVDRPSKDDDATTVVSTATNPIANLNTKEMSMESESEVVVTVPAGTTTTTTTSSSFFPSSSSGQLLGTNNIPSSFLQSSSTPSANVPYNILTAQQQQLQFATSILNSLVPPPTVASTITIANPNPQLQPFPAIISQPGTQSPIGIEGMAAFFNQQQSNVSQYQQLQYQLQQLQALILQQQQLPASVQQQQQLQLLQQALIQIQAQQQQQQQQALLAASSLSPSFPVGNQFYPQLQQQTSFSSSNSLTSLVPTPQQQQSAASVASFVQSALSMPTVPFPTLVQAQQPTTATIIPPAFLPSAIPLQQQQQQYHPPLLPHVSPPSFTIGLGSAFSAPTTATTTTLNPSLATPPVTTNIENNCSDVHMPLYYTVQDRPAHVSPVYNGVNGHYPGLRVLTTTPPIYVVEQFLSSVECDYLINVASDSFAPAPVVGAGNGEISASRTSSTCYLAREDLPWLLYKVHNLTGKPVEHCELPQVGRYHSNEFYLQHYDAFDLSTADGRRFAANGGQRIVTVLIYLNTIPAGGGGTTKFPSVVYPPDCPIGAIPAGMDPPTLEIQPQQGTAVIFFPATVDGYLDQMALHAALPPVHGHTKYVSQIWIRQSTYHGTPSKRIVANTTGSTNTGTSNTITATTTN